MSDRKIIFYGACVFPGMDEPLPLNNPDWVMSHTEIYGSHTAFNLPRGTKQCRFIKATTNSVAYRLLDLIRKVPGHSRKYYMNMVFW